MKHIYVTVIVESILAGLPVEEVLARTKRTLTKRGHLRLWSQVLKAAVRELESKLRSAAPEVRVASEAVTQADIATALRAIGAEEREYRLVVDKTLIGGAVARYQGLVLDTSYKRALVDLYRAITK